MVVHHKRVCTREARLFESMFEVLRGIMRSFGAYRFFTVLEKRIFHGDK